MATAKTEVAEATLQASNPAVQHAPEQKAASKKTAVKNVASKKTSAASSPEAITDFVPYKPKKNEEYMSADMRAHFRAMLINWRNQLMAEVDKTVDHMKDEAHNFADPNDRATQEEEFALTLRTRDRERKLIRKIGKTIDRIDDDDYGWCDQCGIEIGIGRLEARPTADLCIDCKTLDELREKQLKL